MEIYFSFMNSKFSFKAIEAVIICHLPTHPWTAQWNRIQFNIDTHLSSQLIFNKDIKTIQLEKTICSTNSGKTTGYCQLKKRALSQKALTWQTGGKFKMESINAICQLWELHKNSLFLEKAHTEGPDLAISADKIEPQDFALLSKLDQRNLTYSHISVSTN